MPYTYDYPHPAVTVDVAVFTIRGGRLAVVLVRRADWPHAGKWAIPGGFVGIDESLKRAAWRELREETGLRAGYLEQLGAFGRPDRDPRERVITVVYISFAPVDRLELEAGSDAVEAVLDAAHALMDHGVDRYRRPYPISLEEEQKRQQEREKDGDLHHENIPVQTLQGVPAQLHPPMHGIQH